MSIYNIVFRAADQIGILDYVKPVARSVLIASRRAVGQDKRATKNHLKNSKKPKLHIGAGLYRIEGWLNSDYAPKPGVIVVDATREFPFEDSSFDYIYCEHMIEHITYGDSASMLQQCARVLKPGGVIRIVTPNLSVLLDLYQRPEDDLYKAYIEWTWSEMHRVGTGSEAPTPEPAFIINYFVRAWGHSFIYDEKTLRFSLEKAGLTNICCEKINNSRHLDLRNLEHLDRLPPGFYEMESLVMEAEKPE